MSGEEFRKFVRSLEARGELTRVRVPVDPLLEIAAITDRVCKSPGGGPALLFEQVKGVRLPVLTNLFGSPGRMAAALGVEDLEEPGRRLAAAIAPLAGSGAERLQRLLAESHLQPVMVGEAACREVRDESPDLRCLPALKGWPGDGGRFFTQPLVFTRHPESGAVNCGLYRVQVFDARGAALHWSPGSGGAAHYAAWQARGERMPVAIALGADPALVLAAAAPLPAGIDEAVFAGWLRGRPLEMTFSLAGELAVPAAAEILIEGYLEPGEMRPEGPFGNHTGYYAPAAPCPLLHVTAVSHRRDPLCPATVVGRPPMENCWLGRAIERLFLPLLQVDVPELADFRFILEGMFHGCALASVAAGDDPERGKKLLRRLWSGGLLKKARMLAAFDAEVDLRDGSLCLWRAFNNVDPGLDLLVDKGRLGIDATHRDGRPAVEPDPATAALVAARWAEYGIKLDD
ncbi:menaquinone biosynthesis decarboxylase [Desulfuromonas versatilis]|uniref:Menaquinone biosynthesis decarboxylase n=1 Tax=Desulfuromonas versatilis TaxID=2802975 RepID=A0ABN6DSB6_9BACT|nr:UbiD family decarboxylase [Desulfuromonas versatilis]BCR03088.1 menaquinone biosynthesis decarboxylase [Desulfuromonas versatilis]